eukprot:s327_g8.t1
MEHETPADLSLAIPRSGPPATAAGGDPVPMNTEAINQPVVAYFTFIQNNLAQITIGNAAQVMREAEQRHLQIMHEVIGQLRDEWASRLAAQEQEFEQRLHDAEAATVAAKAEVEKLKSEANKMHDHALENEIARLASDFEISINQTIDHATKSIDNLKKECEDRVASSVGVDGMAVRYSHMPIYSIAMLTKANNVHLQHRFADQDNTVPIYSTSVLTKAIR